MVKQVQITLPPYPKGFHLITNEVLKSTGELPDSGLMHVFILHTSAGLAINENADETVRKDMVMAYRDWETDRKSTRLNSSHRL